MRLVACVVAGLLAAPPIAARAARRPRHVGAGISVSAVPRALESAYDGRWPLGLSAFLGTRPGPMKMGAGTVHAR